MVDPIYTDALIYASLLAMLAIGLTLTYITTRVPNFAHASVAMVGAYIALIITRVVAQYHLLLQAWFLLDFTCLC